MNWAMVVENMPGAKWVVTVRRGSETLAEHAVPFTDTVATDGLLIGTVLPVHVLLPDVGEIPPTRIRVTAGSCHSFAAVLEGVAHCFERRLTGEYNRFDWRPLTVGNCVVDVGFQK
jgi:hypothetical protein